MSVICASVLLLDGNVSNDSGGSGAQSQFFPTVTIIGLTRIIRAAWSSSLVKTERQRRLDRLQRFLARAPRTLQVLNRYPLLAGVAFRATEAGALTDLTSELPR
jgi:hypothetical protein